MKRTILIILLVILLTGCVNIKKSDYENIVEETLNTKVKIYNTYRNGYKMYIPHGLYIDKSTEYNEIIKGPDENYYLYIDVISYLNKKENDYAENSDSVYSKLINDKDNTGYIEINQKNDKYLVEIMYNYAKIEVMVDENRLKNAVSNSMIILSSIYYNDRMLKNLSDDNVLNFNEETIDIFSTKGRENSNFLEYKEEYDGDYKSVPDYDLIN